MHESSRVANLLGATGLAATDLALSRVARGAGISLSAAAALVVLAPSPGLSATELGRRIGLSQPAAARMVDTLQGKGLVERGPGGGREVSVTPTGAGLDTATRLLDGRGELLRGLVSVLDAGEQQALAALLEKVLAGLHARVGSPELLCRLCDRASCTAGAACPVGQAERDRAG